MTADRPEPSPRDSSPRSSVVVRLLSPWVTIPFGLLLVAVAAPFIYRASRLNGVPEIEVFDVEAFLDFEVDPDAGCWPGYRRAVALAVPDTTFIAAAPSRDEFDAGYDRWDSDNEAFRRYLDANGPALEVWREAMQEEFRPRIHPRDRSFFDYGPAVIESREFVRLAVLSGQRALADGDPDQTWRWYAAALRFAGHLNQHSPSIATVCATAYASLATDPIVEWARDEAVTADDLRDARRLMAEIDAGTPPLSQSVKVEYVLVRDLLHNASPTERRRAIRELAKVDPRWIEHEPELGLRLIDHSYAHALEMSELTWHEWTLRRNNLARHLATSSRPDVLGGDELDLRMMGESKIAGTFGDKTFAGILQLSHRRRSRRLALDVVLAAELQRRETGRYPATAADFDADILTAVPDDPYAAPGVPLHYEVRDGRPYAWSIGPDGNDDGGRLDGHRNWDDVSVPSAK